MKPQSNIFSFRHIVSSVLMLLALAWLTISIPFVYNHQKAQNEISKQQAKSCEDNTNPLSNSNEEKTESGINTLSEYLHETHIAGQLISIIDKYYKCHSSDLYFAYHPELISPPPEV